MMYFVCVVIILLIPSTTARSYGLQRRDEKCESHGPEVFTAILSSPSESGTIIFDEVPTNVGGSYNKETGVFKASKQGIYTFFWTAISSSRFVRSELRVGNVVYGSAVSDLLPDDQFTQDEVASSVTIGLKAKDEVSIYSDNTLLKGSVFTGYLVNTNYASAFYARSIQQIINKTVLTEFNDEVIDTEEEFDGSNFVAGVDGFYVITASGSTFGRQVDLDIDLNDGVQPITTADEEWEDPDEIYNKAVSNTLLLQLELNDNVNVRIDGNGPASIRIDEKTAFSGFLQEKAPKSAVTLSATGMTTCNPECVAFSDDPEEVVDINNDFNTNTGEFTVPEDGLYAIAVTIESQSIVTTYNIEVNDKILFTGQNTGPIIPEDSGLDWETQSKRVVVEYLRSGDVVKITLTGTYRTGSSLSIWNLPKY